MLQVPPLQLAVPLVELQTLPQLPQLFTLVLTFVSQPFVAFASQFW
jgi:hypothetical protein